MTQFHTIKRFLPMAFLALSGCSWVPSWPTHWVYKVDVQQGTVVTQEMVAQLRAGMTREQVRFVLGTAPLIDPFHADRWDYTYYFKRGGSDTPVERRYTVYFDNNDHLIKFGGDPLPTESEFIHARVVITSEQAKKAAVDPSVVLPGGAPAPGTGPDSGPAPAVPTVSSPVTSPSATTPNDGSAVSTNKDSPSILDRIRGIFTNTPPAETKSTAPVNPNGPSS